MNVPRKGSQKTRSHVLTAAALTVWLAQPAFCIKARECDWQKRFSSSDFRNAEISRVIKDYKTENPPSPATAEKLASFGRDVVPFMDRLACEKKRHFFFLNPKGGWFGTFTENPYGTHAALVVERLKDRNAIPLLKEMMLDSFGGMAQKGLVNLGAEFSREEIESIIDQDAKAYMAGFRIKTYAQMAAMLSPDTQAAVYTYLFGKFDTSVRLDGSADYNWVTLDNSSTIASWIQIVDLLASTRSAAAKSLLEKQYSNLRHAKANGMGYRPEKFDPLVAEYDKVLAHWE